MYAKTKLETGQVAGLSRVCLKDRNMMSGNLGELTHCSKIIYAYGFERNRLPRIVINGVVIPDDHVTHDVATAQLQVSSASEGTAANEPLCGLYGWAPVPLASAYLPRAKLAMTSSQVWNRLP